MRKEGFQTILLMENCMFVYAGGRWVLVLGVLERVALGVLNRGVLRVLNKDVFGGLILGRCVLGGVLVRSVFALLNRRVLAVLNKGVVVLGVLILDDWVHCWQVDGGLVDGRLDHGSSA